MKNLTRTALLSAAVAIAMSAAGSAQASTIIGTFTDLQGDNVSWSATVDSGVTLSQQICCNLPSNQGDGTILNLVNTTFGSSFSGNVGKQDPLTGFAVNWTGASADTYAIHFGGPHGGNELLILLSDDTSTFDFSMSGTQYALSSLQGFDAPSAAPLPAALPLFATGLGGMGLFGWWRKRKDKRKNATALAAA